MANPIHITKSGEDSPFSIVKRSLLREKRLSFGARAVFAMLWDFPPNWNYYYKQIVEMSPNGMHQLRTYIKELQIIGAIVITPKRLNTKEAIYFSQFKNKKYRAGNLYGQQWVLVTPDEWAIEGKLTKESAPNKAATESMVFRKAGKPYYGKSSAKNKQDKEKITIRNTAVEKMKEMVNGRRKPINKNEAKRNIKKMYKSLGIAKLN